MLKQKDLTAKITIALFWLLHTNIIFPVSTTDVILPLLKRLSLNDDEYVHLCNFIGFFLPSYMTGFIYRPMDNYSIRRHPPRKLVSSLFHKHVLKLCQSETWWSITAYIRRLQRLTQSSCKASCNPAESDPQSNPLFQRFFQGSLRKWYGNANPGQLFKN